VAAFGWVGFTLVVAGLPGALLVGVLLDRTQVQ
jgi:hypothetical protein